MHNVIYHYPEINDNGRPTGKTWVGNAIEHEANFGGIYRAETENFEITVQEHITKNGTTFIFCNMKFIHAIPNFACTNSNFWHLMTHEQIIEKFGTLPWSIRYQESIEEKPNVSSKTETAAST